MPQQPALDRQRIAGDRTGACFAVAVIERVRPEIYAKGGDYDVRQLPETPVVESYGGRVHIAAIRPGRSTTRLEQLLRG